MVVDVAVVRGLSDDVVDGVGDDEWNDDVLGGVVGNVGRIGGVTSGDVEGPAVDARLTKSH